MKTDAAIANLLLDSGAVMVRPDEPFQGNTGMIIPIYTDGRALLGHQPERKKVSGALERMVRSNWSNIDVVAGIVTSGIPWAAWIAASMNLPMIYVRDRAKRHGKKAQIEGILKPGSKVVVVDDVVNTGSSLLTGIAAVRRAGGEPIAAIAISTYQLESTVAAFKKAGVPLHTLTNLRSIMTAARTQGALSVEGEKALEAWVADPDGWGKKVEFERA